MAVLAKSELAKFLTVVIRDVCGAATPNKGISGPCRWVAHAAFFLFALCCGAAQALSIAPYDPLSGGAKWTYRVNDAGTINIQERTIAGTRLFNGSTVTVLRDTSTGAEIYSTNDANGIRRHGEFDPSVFVPGAGTFEVTTTYVPPLVQAPADVTLGMPYPSSGTVTLTYSGLGSFPLDYTVTSSADAFESVSVPAGSFTGALRIRTVTRIFGTITGPGGSSTIDTTLDETVWLASGIGVVEASSLSSGVIDGVPQGSELQTAELLSSNLIDSAPNLFSFSAQTGVALNTVVTSNTITPTGYNSPTLISVSAGGSYSINGTSFVTTPSTINPGQNVRVQQTSASSRSTQTCTTLTIGGVAGSFCATTVAVVPPREPTAVSAAAGMSSIVVNFAAPTSDGGAAIIGYKAVCTSSNGGAPGLNTGGANATSIQVSGLSNGKRYSCTVSASNSAGPGPESAASNAVTPFDITPILLLLLLDDDPPAAVPSAPTNVSAVAGDAAITVSFGAPTSNGGAAIIGFSATCTSSNGDVLGSAIAGPGATSIQVTGLANGNSYTCTVTASNSAGAGVASAPSNAVDLLVSTPGAPTAVSAAAAPGSITVSFGAPASDGGAAITDYTATCTSNGGATGTNSGGASATSIQVTGLTNGKRYTCTVTASNSAGPGPASAPSNAGTPFDITPILMFLLD